MGLSKTYGGGVLGIEATIIVIEVDVIQGTRFYMVGLPDHAVKESQQRIESAILHEGYRMPRQRVVVNLAPADIRKEGTAYDLPIAVGILMASGQLRSKADRAGYLVMGELALDGALRPIRGALPIALEGKKRGFSGMILPEQNAKEAALVSGLEVIGVAHLSEALAFWTGKRTLKATPQPPMEALLAEASVAEGLDFADVKGQKNVKRALEIAAAGGHNVLLSGPPGSGKTMLAKRVPSILPPMTLAEAVETTKVYSVAGALRSHMRLITRRPFRSPHHSASHVSLIGGGTSPQPGEVSLAHHGVLFMDELTECKREVLEVLRQPLEDRSVHIARARYAVHFPAHFIFIASMNPCPCGYFTHPDKECRCSTAAIQRYIGRISGPLLDRIDLHVDVPSVAYATLASNANEESSQSIQARVGAARQRQQARFGEYHKLAKKAMRVFCNAAMDVRAIKRCCVLDADGQALMRQTMEASKLSARGYHRILKVARTIADLKGERNISPTHLGEAIQFRVMDAQVAQTA